ncbi:MAG: DUF2203 domain-containing protein [Candidatus Eisenbacteria bacterium]|nr:DUF2203 domain-containing protein [Candidatus Eisenbacteria bacterium]
MSVRIFTVEEANAVLPEVEAATRSIRDITSRLSAAQDRHAVLSVLGAEAASSPEHAEILAVGLEMEKTVEEYNAVLAQLQAIGAILKDAQHGLVDFYSRRNGRLVFLCWRLGEAVVSHWHEIQGGFGGRRPIEELQSAETGRRKEPGEDGAGFDDDEDIDDGDEDDEEEEDGDEDDDEGIDFDDDDDDDDEDDEDEDEDDMDEDEDDEDEEER